MRRSWIVFVVLLALPMGACRSADSGADQVNEISRVRSGDLDVVLLSRNSAINQGKDTIVIEFRSASDGSLVDVGTVKGSATMPMTGMAPMFGSVEVLPSGPGRYTATSDLNMAGEWRLSLEWNGPAGQGSVTFSPMVQ